MAWPTGVIPTTHLDQDTDSPLQARPAIKQMADQVNIIRENGEPAKKASIYSGYVNSTGATTILPSGWSFQKVSKGVYRLIHNLNLNNANDIHCVAMPTGTGASYSIMRTNQTVNYFNIETRLEGTLVDVGFHFVAGRNI